MIAKLQNLLHDLLTALGLLDRPKLQPIPIKTDGKRPPVSPAPRRR
ncbi:MAG TPA: PA1414 family protein [Pseudomonas sp.]|nr:PA1414 family protein [Pseudomonas sp.]